jgi:maltodextrin utilization protein YvdJ
MHLLILIWYIRLFKWDFRVLCTLRFSTLYTMLPIGPNHKVHSVVCERFPLESILPGSIQNITFTNVI